MGKVIFTVQYEILAQKRDVYLESVKELKTLIKAEGLLSYCAYEVKGKQNTFEEVFTFQNEEAYENYDDGSNERVNVLLSKVEDLKVANSTRYSTLYEIAAE